MDGRTEGRKDGCTDGRPLRGGVQQKVHVTVLMVNGKNCPCATPPDGGDDLEAAKMEPLGGEIVGVGAKGQMNIAR